MHLKYLKCLVQNYAIWNTPYVKQSNSDSAAPVFDIPRMSGQIKAGSAWCVSPAWTQTPFLSCSYGYEGNLEQLCKHCTSGSKGSICRADGRKYSSKAISFGLQLVQPPGQVSWLDCQPSWLVQQSWQQLQQGTLNLLLSENSCKPPWRWIFCHQTGFSFPRRLRFFYPHKPGTVTLTVRKSASIIKAKRLEDTGGKPIKHYTRPAAKLFIE